MATFVRVVIAKLASTANITSLSGIVTVDGVDTGANDLVLVKSQAAGAENGLYYTSTSGAWTRFPSQATSTTGHVDYALTPTIDNATMIAVTSGSSLANTVWQLSTVNPAIGSSSLSFVQMGGTGAAVGGTIPTTITPDASGAAGTSAEASRADHTHGIVAAVAGAATPGDAAAEGVATSFARSDHKHSLPAFGTGAGNFAQGNDARFSDARTPTAHAASHTTGADLLSGVANSQLASVNTQTIKGRTSAGTGPPEDLTATQATALLNAFVASGPTHAQGLVPDPGAAGGTTRFLREDATWTAPPAGSANVGSTTVDFGAFPGSTMATVTITGQTSLLTSSVIRAWIPGKALPGGFTADEHVIAGSLVDVVCSDIIAGTGFTIYVLCRDMGGSPLTIPAAATYQQASATIAQNTRLNSGLPSQGGQTINTLWGTYNVDWSWS